jgi:hypothetical protein
MTASQETTTPDPQGLSPSGKATTRRIPKALAPVLNKDHRRALKEREVAERVLSLLTEYERLLHRWRTQPNETAIQRVGISNLHTEVERRALQNDTEKLNRYRKSAPNYFGEYAKALQSMDDNQIRMEQLIQDGQHKGPTLPWPEIPEN